MDRIVKQTIERLEKVAITPFRKLSPNLAVIIAADEQNNQADYSYLKILQKRAQEYNAHILVFKCKNPIEVSSTINTLKSLPYINGILILSEYGNATQALRDMVPFRLDIDYVSSYAAGKLITSIDPIFYRYAPSTAVAVLKILQELAEDRGFSLTGKNVAIIGRSITVGRSLAELLLRQDMTVTVFHSKSQLPANKFADYDIIVSAIGKPKYLDAEKIDATNKILIDVGINVLEDGGICGDFDYENLQEVADYITPVPQGVGAVTTTCTFAKLFANIKNTSTQMGLDECI